MKRLALIVATLLSVAAVAEDTKYATQNKFYFALIDPAGIDLETSASCTTGDVQFSEDGATFANTTNCFVSEGNGVYSLVLEGSELTGEKIAVTVIDSAAKVWLDYAFFIDTYGHASAEHEVDRDAAGFAASNSVMSTGSVDDATFTPTSSQFETDLTEATSDHYNGRSVIFTSGALLGQAARITGYVLANSKGKFTVSTLTEAPADGDTFVIL